MAEQGSGLLRCASLPGQAWGGRAEDVERRGVKKLANLRAKRAVCARQGKYGAKGFRPVIRVLNQGTDPVRKMNRKASLPPGRFQSGGRFKRSSHGVDRPEAIERR